MYNLRQVPAPAEGISRDQLREQIKAQVQQATADARQAAIQVQQAAGRPGMLVTPAQPTVPVGPVGTPMIQISRGTAEDDIPPRAKDVTVVFFIMVAAVIIALPIMRAFARRIDRGAPVPSTIPPEMQAQMQHLTQSVDAIAIEVERISEGQRFATKMLAEKKPDAAMHQMSSPR